MVYCCDLGAKLHDPRQVLYETDNFFVAPTIGPIGIEGYLLVMSKNCYSGTGDIPESLHKELDEVTKTTKKVLGEVYGVGVQVFEHGPRVCNVRGGGCLDHAHLHVVPGVNLMDMLALDLMHRLESLGQFYRVDRVEGFKRAMEIYQAKETTFFVAESPEDKRVVVEVNHHIPSQYFRQFIGQQRRTDKWDWAIFPEFEIVDRTINQLQGKFD